MTAVLGANGAGKTTLLRTITGLVRAAGRERDVRRPRADPHRPRADARPRASRTSPRVAASSPSSPSRRTSASAASAAAAGVRPEDLERIYALFPALADRRTALAHVLSGGERQMLVLGRALMAEPTVLLLDEPSLGLAPRIVAQLFELVQSLVADEGLTVLLVEQNARSALSIAAPRRRAQPRPGRRRRARRRARRRRPAPPRLPRFLTGGATVQQLVNTVLGGLTLGMVYAAFALALVLIWRSTRIVNFAQAPMAMVTTFIALQIIDAGHSYWLGFAAALLAGLVLGAVVERVLIRPVEGKAEINAVILTLGLFIVLHALASVVFGNRYRSFPAAFGIRGIEVGDTTIALTGFGIFTIARGARRDGPAGAALPLHRPRPADARRGVQPGGRPAARRPGRPDAHPRLGARLAGRLAGRPADRRRQPGAPRLHGLGRRLRLRRRGARRPRQPRRRGRRRPAARGCR